MEAAPEREWLEVANRSLQTDELIRWATRPGCGAVVTFCGTVRDHSSAHDQVRELEYETDESMALGRMTRIVAVARRRWPTIEAVALHHRVGVVELGENAVVVCVSAPHRGEAFDAARFCIDTLKTSVPMWKLERWDGGEAWSADATELSEVPDE